MTAPNRLLDRVFPLDQCAPDSDFGRHVARVGVLAAPTPVEAVSMRQRLQQLAGLRR